MAQKNVLISLKFCILKSIVFQIFNLKISSNTFYSINFLIIYYIF
jgi:hypothetical protein